MLVGIDLGTTNSLVAVYRDGESILIPNALGHKLTPSVVSISDDGELLVGMPARERLTTHPDKTQAAFKRWMGTDRKLQLGNRLMRPEELSALVLKSLKTDAEKWLGESVTEAVITVPAYFNDVQRQATKAAGALAGLKVDCLLNEPTAAGLAYGLQERAELCTFLVFDLGGGTFDVSVLEYFEGVVEVRASAGDTRLGGEDFVDVLMAWFLQSADGIDKLSEEQKDTIARDKLLWRTAEQVKRDLCKQDAAVMQWQHDGQSYTLNVLRKEYEQRCEELLIKLRKPLERAMADARIGLEDLDDVVLVGGASRMPIVRNLVARLFGRIPLRTIDPDETIALGAAIQAGLKARDETLKEVVLTDVMPYSMGVISSTEIKGKRFSDKFSPIIERNMPVPISREESYYTVMDGQSEIEFDIRQGESPIGSENLHLGKLDISISAKPAGQVGVNVRFTYDINGLLEVQAHVPTTGVTKTCVLQRNGSVMSAEEIEKALEKLAGLKIHPRDKDENVYLVERAKRLYEEKLGFEREAIGDALAQFSAVLDSQDEHLIRQHRVSFKSFLDSADTGFIL